MQNIPRKNFSFESKPLAAYEMLYLKSFEVIFAFIADVLTLSRTVVRNTINRIEQK